MGLNLGTCTVESLGLEGDRRQIIPLGDITQARLSGTASIVLDTTHSTIPLTAPLGSNPNLSRGLVVVQINQFLQNPIALRITFQDDGRAFAYSFGCIFLLGSAVMLRVFGAIVSYQVDWHTSTLTLTRKSVLSNLAQRYPLHSIHSIALECVPGDPDLGGCRLYLNLHSGRRIPLTHRYLLSYQDAAWVVEKLTPLHPSITSGQ